MPRDALLLVPLNARPLVLHHLHDELPFGGHFGVRKTLATVRSRYFWGGLQRDVKDYIASCSVCQQSKGIRSRLPGVPNLSPPVRPREQWQIDVIGPLPQTPDGFVHIIAAVDEFSGWVELSAIKSVDARATSHFILREIVSRHGVPRRILTDRGSNFEAEVTKALCRLMGINKVASSPMHPMTQGKIERVNGELIAVINRMLDARNGGNDWADWLHQAAGALRMTPNQFGITPFELMSGGVPPRTTLDVMSSEDVDLPTALIDADAFMADGRTTSPDDVGPPSSRLTATHRAQLKEMYDLLLANKTVMRQQQHMVRRARQNVQKQMDRVATVRTTSPRGYFPVGTKVWVFVPNERAPKFWKFWVGPFVIAEVYRDRVARIYSTNRPSHIMTIHVDRLKPWRDPASVFAGAQGDDNVRPDGDDDESVFEVEQIIDERHQGTPRHQYLVEWKGYPRRYNSWVDPSDLHADECLLAYERSRLLEPVRGEQE